MNYWQFISSKISKKKAVYLLTVIEHKGSSPGRQGFKMVVAEDEIFGSIGGGVMEFNLVEHCKVLLTQQDHRSFIKHQIHKGTIKDGSGMICSGEQTILFAPILPSHIDLINEIQNAIDTNSTGVFTINTTTIDFSSQEQMSSKYAYTHTNEHDWSYKEYINKKDTIYIVGGGHVGLATTKLFNALGFFTIVLDNRTDLNTFEHNSFTNEKKVISYEDITEHIPEDTTAYIVIMTNTYTDDKLVLSKLLDRSYQFIGVLGSRAKLKVMFDVLKKEGFSNGQLQQVHAPVGIKIYSQTPLEIAVSIAAQVIAIKNKK